MTKNVADELAGLELPVERGCPFAPPPAYELTARASADQQRPPDQRRRGVVGVRA